MQHKIRIYCPVCNKSVCEFLYFLYDDRYGYPGKFKLMRCKNCTHIFLQSNLTPVQITELYSNYYPRSTFNIDQCQQYHTEKKFSWLNGVFASAYKWVPEKVRVLDIGCGTGQSLAYFTKRGCEAYGVETDKNISQVVEKYNFNVHIGLFDPNIYNDNFFDYITMSQVFEHMTDPVKTLIGVAEILKSGGKAIITTPNCHGWGALFFGKRWINWHAPYHHNFFSEKSMRITVEKAGLSVAKICTITSSEWLNYQWIHLKTYPKFSVPSVFWSNMIQPNTSEKIWLKIFSLIHKCKINHLITRFFDTAGLGDSKIFILEKK